MHRVIPFLALLLLFGSLSAYAQIPHTISYQGILTDGSGDVVSDGVYQLTLKLYDSEFGGIASWTEVQDVGTVDGLFNAILGSRSPLQLLFGKQLWLGLSVENEAELAPRIKLTASAYSIRAAFADSAYHARTIGGYTLSSVPQPNSLLPLDGSGKFPSSVIPGVPVVIDDGSITAAKISSGEIVKSINTLHDDVELAAGSNVSITPNGNTLTISATPGGGGGDITAVTTTGGLSGGGTSGDVVLSIADQGITPTKIASDAVLESHIAHGQVVKNINGITDYVMLNAGPNISIAPAGGIITISATATGDITAVNTPVGSGLTGGTTTGDAILSIADGGVTTAKLADNAVTTIKLADNAVTESKLADLSVTANKIDNQSIRFTKLVGSDGNPGQVLTTDGLNVSWRNPAGFTLPYAGSVSNAGAAFQIYNSSTSSINDHAIIALSEKGNAVYGQSKTGSGLVGRAFQPGVYGVYGYNQDGDGVKGASAALAMSGVYGENSQPSGYGVSGRNTSRTTQGGLGNPTCGASGQWQNAFVGELGSSGSGAFGKCISNSNWTQLGTLNEGCRVNGSFYQTGGTFEAHPTSTTWTTNKPATVKLNNGKQVKLFAVEATEVLFSDRGEGQLTDGRAHIDLDPVFLQTVTINAKHPMQVFVQLLDDCGGVFVTNRTATGFDVVELQHGTSNAHFSYRVDCKRKYYEDERLATEEEDIQFNTRMLETAWPEVIEEREAMNEKVRQSTEEEMQRMRTVRRNQSKVNVPCH